MLDTELITLLGVSHLIFPTNQRSMKYYANFIDEETGTANQPDQSCTTNKRERDIPV